MVVVVVYGYLVEVVGVVEVEVLVVVVGVFVELDGVGLVCCVGDVDVMVGDCLLYGDVVVVVGGVGCVDCFDVYVCVRDGYYVGCVVGVFDVVGFVVVFLDGVLGYLCVCN